MSVHVISATEASRALSKILNKVHYQGECYEIKRGNEIIAQIIPVTSKKSVLKVSELNKVFKHLPAIENQDKLNFNKDIERIRAQNKLKDESWD